MIQTHSKKVLLFGVAAGVATLSSCSKYQDGPAFSLLSKTARLTGEWDLIEAPGFTADEDVIFEFQEDGDFKFSTTYSYGGSTYSYSYTGTWEFTSDKEDVIIDIDGDISTFKILRLTNSELNFDYDGDEWQFEKQ